MTLLEMTVVILVLLALLSILFIGAQAWKRGSDRSTCIMQIRNMQVAARSFQNIYGYAPGEQPNALGGTQNIAEQLLIRGYITDQYYDNSQGTLVCPGGGTYSTPTPNAFPATGSLYMICSLATTFQHEPTTFADW